MTTEIELPRKLYKYRPVNEYTLTIVTDEDIYFPGPDAFNDPFDCRVVYSTDCTEEGFREAMARNHLGMKSTLERRLPQQQATSWLYERKDDLVSDAATAALDDLIRGTGVYCFTEVADNILMWSHYADNHEGVCLEFDTQIGFDLFQHARPVDYSIEYPTYECFNPDLSQLARKAVFRKSLDWSYEREWRIIGVNKAGQTERLPRGTLSGIIIGARITAEKEEAVREWARQSQTSPLVRKAILKDGEYGLDGCGAQ